MPSMTVLSLGLNHTTASVDLRGRFAFAVDQLSPVLRTLQERFAPTSRTPQAAEMRQMWLDLLRWTADRLGAG